MSEPLSSTEIEDVLSSIRRLVSEDMRPTPRKFETIVPEVGEKLILTPALRVVETEDQPVPRFVATPRAKLDLSDPRPVSDQGEARSLDDVFASVGAAVDAADDEWENAPVQSPNPAPQSWVFEPDDETFDEVYSPEPSVEVIEPVAESNAGALSQFEQDAAVPGWAQTDDETDDDLDAHDTIPEASATNEPDPIWVAAAEASVIEALSKDADRDDFDEEEREYRFNEDVLRELVRDILREELAGSMGERITRNIRKLVRTEIARTIAAQELS